MCWGDEARGDPGNPGKSRIGGLKLHTWAASAFRRQVMDKGVG